MSVCLSDVKSGDGGWCVLKGSHKLNFPVPLDIAEGVSELNEHIYQVCLSFH